jgi:hypothetical protein
MRAIPSGESDLANRPPHVALHGATPFFREKGPDETGSREMLATSN